MRLTLSVFAAYLATVTVALPTTPGPSPFSKLHHESGKTNPGEIFL